MANKELGIMYEELLHDKRIRYGNYLSAISIVVFPLFYIKDRFMTEYPADTLVWRALPIICALIFILISHGKVKHNRIIIKYFYLFFLYSFLIMMFGVFYINYGIMGGKFNSFLIAGLITTMLVIHTFISPVRRYMPLFTLSTIVFFIFLLVNKGGDKFLVSQLLNPILIIASVWVIAINAEKMGFNEFTSRFLLELSERSLQNEVEYRKCLEKQLQDEIVIEPLTGIYNRRAAENMIPQKLKEYSITPERLSLVFIDLDNLKMINDNLGHNAGDRFIKSFVNLAKRTLVEDDFIFRVGGDEFIILFTNKLKIIALNKVREIRETCHAEGISFSFGLTSYGECENCNVDELIRKADIQMYNYKKQRRIKIDAY